MDAKPAFLYSNQGKLLGGGVGYCDKVVQNRVEMAGRIRVWSLVWVGGNCWELVVGLALFRVGVDE